MRKGREATKLNNRGAALVTVIVVIAFITILATILLYISAVNYQIKVSDYKTKTSFYHAEIAMETIRQDLMTDVSLATENAYGEMVSQYVVVGGADTRQKNFNQIFLDKLNEILAAHSDLKVYYQGIAGPVGNVVVEFPDATDKDGDGVLDYTSESVEKGWMTIDGIRLTYTDANGYSSVISTDFYIQIPDINWAADSSPVNLMGTDEERKKKALTQVLDINDYVVYMNWKKQ